MRDLLIGAGLLALLGIPSARAVTVLDTGGFEGYAPGNIVGQQGWQAAAPPVGTTARPVTQVDIVDGPQGSGKVIQFNNVKPNQAAIQVRFEDLNGKYAYARSAFDFYRETDTGHNNLNWWPTGNNPWWGIAWDTGPDVVPFFNGNDNTTGYFRQTPDTWIHVDQIWDLANGKGSAWVNGVLVADNIDIGKGQFNGWYFNDWQTLGSVGYKAYIDNLLIVAGDDLQAIPEPSSLALLVGALPLLGLRRRKSA